MADSTLKDLNLRLPAGRFGRFDPKTDSINIAFADDQLVVLFKKTEGKEVKSYPRIWGDLRQLNVFDVLHLLNSTHASGRLVVSLEDRIEKSIFVKNGEIIFAQSNINDDRLGESLIRAGKITQEQLDDAAQAIGSGNRLGKILIDLKLITPKELFAGVRRQVEEIVIGLIAQRQGRLAFHAGLAGQDLVELPLDTRKLLITGLRNSAPWSEVGAETNEASLFLALATNPNHMGLNTEERKLVTMISSGVSLKQLIDQSGFGELNTWRYVHQLLLRDIVTVANLDPDQQPQLAAAHRKALDKVLASFQTTFSEIFHLLSETASQARVEESLASFFAQTPEEFSEVFKGQTAKQGQLDYQRLLASLPEATPREQRLLLDRALRELLNFMLFESHHLAPTETVKQIVTLIQKVELF